MSTGLLLFFAAVGWCGTPWPWWWRKPPPPPPPDPWWFIDRIIGILGGVLGGWLFIQTWPLPADGAVALEVAAAGVGAFVGSLIVLDLYGMVRGGRAATSVT